MFASNARLKTANACHEPAAFLQGDEGYFYLAQKYPGETPKFKQVPFKLADLDATLDAFYDDPCSVGLRPDCDSYISQGVLASADSREAVNVISLSTVWLEFDLGKAGLDPVATLPAIEARRIELGLPPFSIVNFSGRGLHCKLNFYEIGPDQFTAWRELIASLAAAFPGFGVDTSVFDPSRVLRLPGTLNTKAGEHCRTLKATGDVYEFSDLCEIVRPFNDAPKAAPKRPDLTNARADRPTAPRPALPPFKPCLRLYNNPRVNWQAADYVRLAFADVERLMYLRHEGGTLPEGERNDLIFIACVFLAGIHAGDYRGFLAACWELCQRHCTWTERELADCITTLTRRHLADCKGDALPEGSSQHVYTYKVKTLIKCLGITAQEQVRLKVLVDDAGRQERDRLRKEAARREAGTIERTAYLEAATGKKNTALRLHAEGLSVKEIAENLGITERSVFRYLAVVTSVSVYAGGETQGGEILRSLLDTETNSLSSIQPPAAVAEVKTRAEAPPAAFKPQGKPAAPAYVRPAAPAIVGDGWGGAWADMAAIIEQGTAAPAAPN